MMHAGNGRAFTVLTSRAGGLPLIYIFALPQIPCFIVFSNSLLVVELGFAACRLLDNPSNGKPILIASCHPNRTIACQHQIRTRCLPMNAEAQRTRRCAELICVSVHGPVERCTAFWRISPPPTPPHKVAVRRLSTEAASCSATLRGGGPHAPRRERLPICFGLDLKCDELRLQPQ